jgi:phytoene desaturase
MQNNIAKSQVLVVGAGIGGIATAARLARHGCQVTVIEKCEKPGGRCGQMKIKGYTFDSGATLFMMPEVYTETFTALGERMQDHLNLQRVDPTYQLYFPDETRLLLTSDMHRMMDQLEAIEPGSFEQMLRYLAEGRRIYRLSLDHLVGRDFRSLPEFINPRMLGLFMQLKALTRHTDQVRSYFKDARLQMAFTFQDMYMGLSPYDAPATYSLMQATELVDGLWYPQGGMYSITRALTAVAEKLGVQFLYNTSVEQILIKGSRATGVRLADGQEILADTVVANADLGYVYRHLLPDQAAAEQIDRKEYGCSTIMFYWGLDKQYPQLGPHNLFLCGDYRQSFDQIFKKLGMPERPNFYIHAPVRMDPSMAPAGHDTWYVAVPVGHISSRSAQDWSAMQTHARSFILQQLARLGLTDVESHIRVEVSFLPGDWQNRYNLMYGSTHGLSHKLTQMAYLRPHNRHSQYHNLYFVGASTHPGTGVPTVLISARLTAERVLEENALLETAQNMDTGRQAQ